MQRYTIAQAKSREKGKNIFRKNNMVHVAWRRYYGLAVEKCLLNHRTPTEVRMYPDRGTHVSRPRYAHLTTEVRRHVSPTNLSSPIKKGTALFKAVPFFCSILSLFYPSLAMRLMSSRLLATGSEVSKPGRNMPCWRMLSSRARSGFQKPPML